MILIGSVLFNSATSKNKCDNLVEPFHELNFSSNSSKQTGLVEMRVVLLSVP